MLRDLRHAVRILFQAKGWTAVVVLSLALGIGANTAVFGTVNGLLLKTVPVRDPGTLVRLRWAGPNDMATSSSEYGNAGKNAAGEDTRATFSYPMFQKFVAENKTMSDLAACAPFGRVNVQIDGQAELANSFIATGNYFTLLGVAATAGRTLGPDDDRPDAPPAVVISDKYWRTRFAGDRQAVGRAIKVNNVPVTIVGVIAPEFTGIQQAVADAPDITMPMALDAQVNTQTTGAPRASRPTYWWVQVVGRVKPGATPAQVRANLENVFQQTARAGFDDYLASLPEAERAQSGNANRTRIPHLMADPAARGVYEAGPTEVRSATILSVVVGLVLLIVCANVANLLLSRASTRQKEISIRLSMGATRGRLIRQMLTESLMLSFAGGLAGLLVGYWSQQALPDALGKPVPLDWRLIGFTIALTTATGVLFGILPALRATRVNVSTALKEQSRSVIGSKRVLSQSLLVMQVAISLVLLVGAGLFLRTLQNLRDVSVGFNPQNLVLFSVNPGLNRYEPAKAAALYGQMLERLRAVPGVRAAALSQPALLSGSVNSTSIFVQGRTYVRGDRNRDSINRLVVSPGFFSAMEMPLAAGREFTERDVEAAPRVALINEAAARKYFKDGSALGQRFGSSIEESGRNEIVGIVRDAKYNSVRDEAPPTMYVPYLQARPLSVNFEVRSAGDPAALTGAIREAVKQIDPNLPVNNISTQMEQIDRRLLQERIFAQAYTLFGGIAIVVASIGLFGLLSYNVSRRTAEIGVRLALGAQRRDVLTLVMREALWMVLIGVGIGLGITFAAGRWVRTLLYGLAPHDAMSIAAAIAVMLAVSALAGYLPARRASKVDPLVALRVQ